MCRTILFTLSSWLIISCDNQTPEQFAVETNYTFFDRLKGDSIKCIHIGNQYINEANTISFNAVKHECVDQTKAIVKIEGTLINISTNSFIMKTENDTIAGVFNFNIESPRQFEKLEIITQGVIQIHPQINYKVDAVLLKGISKKNHDPI
ncbi:hypothetical protein N9Q76_02570 [Flavobacteriales bacterium]|nr:hypothetical protein [Flavobacteriales bacterium]|tara:strand:- start:20 stop:469 length:450 start_codon:yes stop_codon:yes gene_type:complete